MGNRVFQSRNRAGRGKLFVEFSLRFYPTHSIKKTHTFGANGLCLHSSNAVQDKGNTTSNWLFSTGGLRCIMSSLKYKTTQWLKCFICALHTRSFQAGTQPLYSRPFVEFPPTKRIHLTSKKSPHAAKFHVRFSAR